MSSGKVRSNASATASTRASGDAQRCRAVLAASSVESTEDDIMTFGIGFARTPVSVVQDCICRPASRCSAVIVCTALSLTGRGGRYGGFLACGDQSSPGKRSQNSDSIEFMELCKNRSILFLSSIRREYNLH